MSASFLVWICFLTSPVDQSCGSIGFHENIYSSIEIAAILCNNKCPSDNGCVVDYCEKKKYSLVVKSKKMTKYTVLVTFENPTIFSVDATLTCNGDYGRNFVIPAKQSVSFPMLKMVYNSKDCRVFATIVY